MSCPTLITPSCPAPTGHLFPCCMYRITALRCVPTVHTVWVWCVEYGADGCFVLAKTEIAVFGLRQHHQHVAGKDFAVFLPEHVLQHLPGQENAIILTGHVLGLRLCTSIRAFGAKSARIHVHGDVNSCVFPTFRTDSGTFPLSGRQLQGFSGSSTSPRKIPVRSRPSPY